MEAKHGTPAKKILIAVAIVVVAGLAAYLYWDAMRSRPAPVKEAGKAPVAGGPAVTVVPAPPQAPPKDVCAESRERLQGLFAYLDGRDYIASYELKGGTAEHFKGIVARLLETAPFVQREETQSLERVLRNRAHFFRILGKKDALLLRDIVRKEGDRLESFLASAYQSMLLQETCGTKGPWLHAPLEKVYPYAVFFLNSMGGSSYLMRRDSRVRILVRYYSILVLDQANQRKLNRLGVDVRPALELTIGDLKGASNLTARDEYLETLRAVAARY